MNLKHDLIFKQWVASLQDRDRSRTAIQGNFEELFYSLKNAGISQEEAYALLPNAIKAHQPNQSLIRNVYRKVKAKGHPYLMPEKEFGESWCKDIAEKGNIAFFEVFPVETITESVDDQLVHGSMTKKEYKMQRQLADSFPSLDLEALQKRFVSDNYNPVADIAAMMRNNGDFK